MESTTRRRGTALGDYIRTKRQAAGLSLRDVADKLGISHVRLGEVERGVRLSLKQERLARLEEIIPGFSLNEAERMTLKDRPLQMSLEQASPVYTNLALALARRIEKRDLKPKQIVDLMQILRGNDEDE